MHAIKRIAPGFIISDIERRIYPLRHTRAECCSGDAAHGMHAKGEVLAPSRMT
jgi:hypothetical protein